MRKNILVLFLIIQSCLTVFASEMKLEDFPGSLDGIETLKSQGVSISLRTKKSVDFVPLQECFKIETGKEGKKIVIYFGEIERNNFDMIQVKSDIAYNLFSLPEDREKIIELMLNSELGSFLAQHDLFELYKKHIKQRITFFPGADYYLKKWNDSIESELKIIDAKARQQMKERNAKWEEYRRQKNFDQLDQLELKLNDYVKKNDRINAAKLIESYLPWPLMEPMEKLYWQRWLDSVRNPDFSKAIYLYRGLSDKNDPKQLLELKSGKINMGFFSPILTKNQGNYNRRLRSLSAQRSRFMRVSDLKYRSFTFAEKFRDHASEPVASYFLSLSAGFETARSFVEFPGGLMVTKMDPRRLVFNVTGLSGEQEVLVPIVIFPDEVVLHKESRKNYMDEHFNYKKFIKDLPENVIHELEKTNDMDFKDFYTLWDQQLFQLVGNRGLRCEKIF